eukprot:4855001-Prymnesium_polylepis.1
MESGASMQPTLDDLAWGRAAKQRMRRKSRDIASCFWAGVEPSWVLYSNGRTARISPFTKSKHSSGSPTTDLRGVTDLHRKKPFCMPPSDCVAAMMVPGAFVDRSTKAFFRSQKASTCFLRRNGPRLGPSPPLTRLSPNRTPRT